MSKNNEFVWRIADFTENYRTELNNRHILINGVEGSGKSFIIQKFAEEYTSRGFLVAKFFYPHCDIVDVESLIKDLDCLLGKEAFVLIDDFDKLLMSMTMASQKKLLAFFSNTYSPLLVVSSTGTGEDFVNNNPLFKDIFKSFQIPKFEIEDLEDLLPEDIYNKVKDNSEFLNLVMKLRGNLNYIISFANYVHPNYGLEDTLDAIINENERYFRYKFSTLPAVQQRALYGLASSGDTGTSAEVQSNSGLSCSNTASALFRLEKHGIITKAGGKKRSVEYRIADYLFGKWIVE